MLFLWNTCLVLELLYSPLTLDFHLSLASRCSFKGISWASHRLRKGEHQHFFEVGSGEQSLGTKITPYIARKLFFVLFNAEAGALGRVFWSLNSSQNLPVAYCHGTGFVQRFRRDGAFLGVLDHHRRCSVHVSMDVYIMLSQVTLDNQLVLLLVPSTDNCITDHTDEERKPHWLNFRTTFSPLTSNFLDNLHKWTTRYFLEQKKKDGVNSFHKTRSIVASDGKTWLHFRFYLITVQYITFIHCYFCLCRSIFFKGRYAVVLQN